MVNLLWLIHFLNANNLDTVYMRTANLPIRYMIIALDTLDSTATLQQVCSTTMIEVDMLQEV